MPCVSTRLRIVNHWLAYILNLCNIDGWNRDFRRKAGSFHSPTTKIQSPMALQVRTANQRGILAKKQPLHSKIYRLRTTLHCHLYNGSTA